MRANRPHGLPRCMDPLTQSTIHGLTLTRSFNSTQNTWADIARQTNDERQTQTDIDIQKFLKNPTSTSMLQYKGL